jgi:hypothetical protein
MNLTLCTKLCGMAHVVFMWHVMMFFRPPKARHVSKGEQARDVISIRLSVSKRGTQRPIHDVLTFYQICCASYMVVNSSTEADIKQQALSNDRTRVHHNSQIRLHFLKKMLGVLIHPISRTLSVHHLITCNSLFLS